LQSQTRLRLPRESQEDEGSEWQNREEDWVKFWKGRGGTGSLTKTGKVVVDGTSRFILAIKYKIYIFLLAETFFVDLVLRNPLDAEVNLSNVTIVVEESHSGDASSSKSFLDVEVVEDLTLGPRESRTVRFYDQLAGISNPFKGPDCREIVASDKAHHHARCLRFSLPPS
jgi:hypothetical protein